MNSDGGEPKKGGRDRCAKVVVDIRKESAFLKSSENSPLVTAIMFNSQHQIQSTRGAGGLGVGVGGTCNKAV